MIRDKQTLQRIVRSAQAGAGDDRIVRTAEGGAGGSWMAKRGTITACNYETGIVSVDVGSQTVTASQGAYGWHVVGDAVVVVRCGGSPAFAVIPQIGGARHYEPVAGSSSPPVKTDCGA